MSIIDKLTNYLVDTTYSDLTFEAVQATKKQVLDTIAVTIAGSTCSIAGEMQGLAEMVKDWGGKEESTILGFGGRVPAPHAAFVNGISCVRLDFDDTLVTWANMHNSRGVIPAALAMAERQGNISGEELITAVALAYDFSCRIKLASGGNKDNVFRMANNFFGSGAAAARLLCLSHEKFQNALFLSFHQMCGAGGTGGGGIRSGASLKGVSNGFATKGGVIAALLAEKGFTAAPEFLEPENRENFYQVFCGGSYLPWVLTKDLGETYAGVITSQKEYPCCHGQHASIEAALSIMKENGLTYTDIEEVTLILSQFDYLLLADPIESKRNPKNIIETQFSVCWGVASAIVYGEVGIRNFSAEALNDARIRSITARTSARMDSAMATEYGFPPAAVEIKTTSGKVFSRKTEFPFGTPARPMSFADIVAKFNYCCGYSVESIPVDNQEKVIRMVEDLEHVKDVSQIMQLLG